MAKTGILAKRVHEEHVRSSGRTCGVRRDGLHALCGRGAMTPFLGTRNGVGWTLGEALRFGGEMSRCGSASVPADHGVRLMAVESGRSVLRAANPGRRDMEVTRATEPMIRAVAVFVGRTV